MQTQQSNQGDGCGGGDIGRWRLTVATEWRLKILVMVDNKTMGDRHLMDAVMDCGKKVARQRR
jgi:hypothetical protein